MSFSKVKSYAKVNLALNVTGKLIKLHKIESIVTFISLHDLIIIKKLRDYWEKDMTPDNKEKVWSYLNNSLKLTDLIIKAGFKF